MRERADASSLPLLLETLRLDKLLHVHASRRMQARESFDFGQGPVLYHFDYQHVSPVNGEALFQELPYKAPAPIPKKGMVEETAG